MGVHLLIDLARASPGYYVSKCKLSHVHLQQSYGPARPEDPAQLEAGAAQPGEQGGADEDHLGNRRNMRNVRCRCRGRCNTWALAW